MRVSEQQWFHKLCSLAALDTFFFVTFLDMMTLQTFVSSVDVYNVAFVNVYSISVYSNIVLYFCSSVSVQKHTARLSPSLLDSREKGTRRRKQTCAHVKYIFVEGVFYIQELSRENQMAKCYYKSFRATRDKCNFRHPRILRFISIFW